MLFLWPDSHVLLPLCVCLCVQEEIKFPARLSEVAKSLLTGLLQKDPSKRWVYMYVL